MTFPLSALDGPGLSILAVGAHPDDIELGCGGSLAKLARAGARIRALVMSKGRRGALSDEDRGAETRLALGRLGIEEINVFDFKDTNLWRCVGAMVKTIEEHVDAVKPDRIYTMFQSDRHQDHRAVYEASVIAGRSVPKLLGYETPSSFPNFMPTVFEPIENDLEAKIEALHCHQSQATRLYMQQDKVRSAANFRGAQVSMGPCEGFVPYKLIL